MNQVLALALAVTGLIFAGCYHGEPKALDVSGIDRIRYDELRYLAAKRLDCPSSRLSYRYDGDKVHVMSGCGETVRYLIFSIDDVWVKVESFHDQAEFKLRCGMKKLRSTRIDKTTWRVAGCRRTAYYALRCGAAGKDCFWENVPRK